VEGRQAATEVAIAAAEQERSRWARELHDETLQALAVVRMRLASALREASPEALRKASQTAVEQIDEEIVKLRRLITELRPASLDAIGLEAALEALAEQHQEVSGIQVACRFEVPPDEVRQPAPVLETTVYRLAQEGLNNVSKHSSARNAELNVLLTREAIAIEVADDGDGFEPSRVSEGFGLVGMRERAALFGGTLDVVSAPGSGTRLRAELPLDGGTASP
jgi:signal transduction histidine kinase